MVPSLTCQDGLGACCRIFPSKALTIKIAVAQPTVNAEAAAEVMVTTTGVLMPAAHPCLFSGSVQRACGALGVRAAAH